MNKGWKLDYLDIRRAPTNSALASLGQNDLFMEDFPIVITINTKALSLCKNSFHKFDIHV